jgi:hypothetical protein
MFLGLVWDLGTGRVKLGPSLEGVGEGVGGESCLRKVFGWRREILMIL